jgi:hypothetical protein
MSDLNPGAINSSAVKLNPGINLFCRGIEAETGGKHGPAEGKSETEE